MEPGMLTTHRNALPITPSGAILIFTEETKSQLFIELQRKAAAAYGIDAMAMRAIDTGDHDRIGMIQSAALELGDALLNLSVIIGQMQTPSAA